jgi:hypothetical protein
MHSLIALLAGAVLLATAPAGAAPRLQGEAELARALEGRVAGKPVRCINLNSVRSSRIIDRTAILYETGGTIYVNRPSGARRSLDRWDTLVTRPFGSRLCSVDIVRLYDTTSRMQTGFVFLGEFVPYRR